MDMKIQTALLIGAILLCIYLVYSYNKKQSEPTSEPFYEEAQHNDHEHHQETENIYNNTAAPAANAPIENKEDDDTVSASQGLGDNEVFASVDSNESNGEFGLNGNQLPKDCFPKDQLGPNDLLPGDANSKWAQVNPSGQGSVGDQNFLNAGYHVGVNTVGQTLRNPNLQLRSEPANPQVQVSPWMNTSMEPDTNRRAMEIGGCE